MSRTKREWEDIHRQIQALRELGISYDDAWTLRRCSMVLRKWFEGEWGNSDNYGSWAIVRGRKDHKPDCPTMFAVDSTDHGPCACRRRDFVHDDDGAPFLERIARQGPPQASHTPIPDREKGARKRIATILAKHEELQAYIQGDPRGCALYVLKAADVPLGEDASCFYTRGIAVF